MHLFSDADHAPPCKQTLDTTVFSQATRQNTLYSAGDTLPRFVWTSNEVLYSCL